MRHLALLLLVPGCTTTPEAEEQGCSGWGDTQTIADVAARMDELPERSIPCMIQSLDRPGIGALSVADDEQSPKDRQDEGGDAGQQA